MATQGDEVPAYEDIAVEKVADGNYAVVSLDRPDKLNALRDQTTVEIADALKRMEMDPAVRCVVLRGTKEFSKKPSFSVGADLSVGFPPFVKPNVPVHMDWVIFDRHRSVDAIEAFPKPLIAAVDGYALGGGFELTLLCDLVVASERSEFGFPEVQRGIFPAYGGTQRLVRHVGVARAKWLIYTGERVPAKQLEQWGYVAKVFPDDQFEQGVHELASKIGKGPTTALYVIKKAINFGTEVPLSIGLKFEQLGFAINSQSSDVVEGINAFFRRKEPEFKGF
ncbi:MAG: hypothetical protein Kow0069_17950 [Promethearchaeota archaeon]